MALLNLILSGSTMLRITYQNERHNKSTGIYIKERSWIGVKQKLKGKNEHSETTNNNIQETRLKVNQLFSKVQIERDTYILNILESIFSKQEKTDTLLKTIRSFESKSTIEDVLDV